MSSSLLPERPLLFSPLLARTIGLEEAIMLQGLSEKIQLGTHCQRSGHGEIRFSSLDDAQLHTLFPFWEVVDLRRIRRSLQTLGLLLVEPDEEHPGHYWHGLVEAEQQAHRPAPAANPAPAMPRPAPTQPVSGTATLIPPDWQPGPEWIRQCEQQGISADFVRGLVPEFVGYWRERGHARFSWGNAFLKWALKAWREEQTRQGAYEMASAMSAEWVPSADAVEILVNSGVSQSFIEDAIPEFVLYWRERGIVNGAWNTKFIEHIRRQWAKFSASFGYDDTPRPIAPNWQPSVDCYEILQLAEIDEEYARSKIPEFVMYWRDSQQARASWNTVFLQFVKQDWARRLERGEKNDNYYAEDQSIAGTSQQRIKERFQRIADRSWAE